MKTKSGDDYLETFRPHAFLADLKAFVVEAFLDQPEHIDLDIRPGSDCFEVDYTLKWTNTDDMLHGSELVALAQFCQKRRVTYLLKIESDFSSPDDDRWLEVTISLVAGKLE